MRSLVFVATLERMLLGTVITGEGTVVFDDVTRFGLHRTCIEVMGKYPDLELWQTLFEGKRVLATRYAEKIMANVFVGHLWFYWKEG